MIQHKDAILAAFKCQQSGNCCKTSGYVYVNQDVVQNMSAECKLSVQKFREKYVKKCKGWDVVAAPDFRSNCFLDQHNQCQVYQSRPQACRSYPDWDYIWESNHSLQQEMKSCPGLAAAAQEVGL